MKFPFQLFHFLSSSACGCLGQTLPILFSLWRGYTPPIFKNYFDRSGSINTSLILSQIHVLKVTDDVCCVCKKSSPPALRKDVSVVFVKWGECSVCAHWVHLSFCTDVRFLRRDSFFRCPHCAEEWMNMNSYLNIEN